MGEEKKEITGSSIDVKKTKNMFESEKTEAPNASSDSNKYSKFEQDIEVEKKKQEAAKQQQGSQGKQALQDLLVWVEPPAKAPKDVVLITNKGKIRAVQRLELYFVELGDKAKDLLIDGILGLSADKYNNDETYAALGHIRALFIAAGEKYNHSAEHIDEWLKQLLRDDFKLEDERLIADVSVLEASFKKNFTVSASQPTSTGRVSASKLQFDKTKEKEKPYVNEASAARVADISKSANFAQSQELLENTMNNDGQGNRESEKPKPSSDIKNRAAALFRNNPDSIAGGVSPLKLPLPSIPGGASEKTQAMQELEKLEASISEDLIKDWHGDGDNYFLAQLPKTLNRRALSGGLHVVDLMESFYASCLNDEVKKLFLYALLNLKPLLKNKFNLDSFDRQALEKKLSKDKGTLAIILMAKKIWDVLLKAHQEVDGNEKTLRSLLQGYLKYDRDVKSRLVEAKPEIKLAELEALALEVEAVKAKFDEYKSFSDTTISRQFKSTTMQTFYDGFLKGKQASDKIRIVDILAAFHAMKPQLRGNYVAREARPTINNAPNQFEKTDFELLQGILFGSQDYLGRSYNKAKHKSFVDYLVREIRRLLDGIVVQRHDGRDSVGAYIYELWSFLSNKPNVQAKRERIASENSEISEIPVAPPLPGTKNQGGEEKTAFKNDDAENAKNPLEGVVINVESAKKAFDDYKTATTNNEVIGTAKGVTAIEETLFSNENGKMLLSDIIKAFQAGGVLFTNKHIDGLDVGLFFLVLKGEMAFEDKKALYEPGGKYPNPLRLFIVTLANEVRQQVLQVLAKALELKKDGENAYSEEGLKEANSLITGFVTSVSSAVEEKADKEETFEDDAFIVDEKAVDKALREALIEGGEFVELLAAYDKRPNTEDKYLSAETVKGLFPKKAQHNVTSVLSVFHYRDKNGITDDMADLFFDVLCGKKAAKAVRIEHKEALKKRDYPEAVFVADLAAMLRVHCLKLLINQNLIKIRDIDTTEYVGTFVDNLIGTWGKSRPQEKSNDVIEDVKKEESQEENLQVIVASDAQTAVDKALRNVRLDYKGMANTFNYLPINWSVGFLKEFNDKFLSPKEGAPSALEVITFFHENEGELGDKAKLFFTVLTGEETAETVNGDFVDSVTNSYYPSELVVTHIADEIRKAMLAALENIDGYSKEIEYIGLFVEAYRKELDKKHTVKDVTSVVDLSDSPKAEDNTKGSSSGNISALLNPASENLASSSSNVEEESDACFGNITGQTKKAEPSMLVFDIENVIENYRALYAGWKNPITTMKTIIDPFYLARKNNKSVKLVDVIKQFHDGNNIQKDDIPLFFAALEGKTIATIPKGKHKNVIRFLGEEIRRLLTENKTDVNRFVKNLRNDWNTAEKSQATSSFRSFFGI